MRLEKDQSSWYSARFTEVPSSSEPVYILTIQSVQENLNRWLNLFVEEHPEMF